MKPIIELLILLKSAPNDEIKWGFCCAANYLLKQDIITDEEEGYIINYLYDHRPKRGTYGAVKGVWWWNIGEVKLRKVWMIALIRKEKAKSES